MKKLVIVACYNEAENIQKLVEQVISFPENFDVLIIDDNSPNGTGEIAEKLSTHFKGRVKVIYRPYKMGLGTAYIVGYKYGFENNYDIMLQIDADFSHNPDDLKKMCSLLENSADIVVGSRYINNQISVIKWPLNRLLISLIASKYLKFLLGFNLTDPTSGLKGFRRNVFQKVNLGKVKSKGFSIQFELVFYGWQKGFKLQEIPIIFTNRKEGKSKMSKDIFFEAILLSLKLFFLRIFRGLICTFHL